jgi:NitT/TauT family transport system substrate-binding protein
VNESFVMAGASLPSATGDPATGQAVEGRLSLAMSGGRGFSAAWSRRVFLAGGLAAVAVRARAAAPIKVGVLRFGTVSWELDVIRTHGLDTANGVTVEPTEVAAAQAAQVSLQAGAVDMIVVDWLWVARQRATGGDWSFVPFSTAVGALIVPEGSAIRSVADLPGRRLGIAGSPLDKSWIILRAYATRKHNIDLDSQVTKLFGPPPLLTQQMQAGRLDALLTYWNFAAKAEAAGARSVLPVEDAVTALGIGSGVPYIGYTFAEHWAKQNTAALNGFLIASRQARSILASSDAEWDRIRPLTGAANDAELQRLRDWYRRGIPREWEAPEREAADQLFALLAKIGGPDLVRPLTSLPPGTFWPVSWHAGA